MLLHENDRSQLFLIKKEIKEAKESLDWAREYGSNKQMIEASKRLENLEAKYDYYDRY